MATINPIQLQKFLKGAEYPMGKDALVALAKDNGADDDVLEALGAIDTPQIAFEMQSQAAPGVFKPVGDESLLIIVMPMTVR